MPLLENRGKVHHLRSFVELHQSLQKRCFHYKFINVLIHSVFKEIVQCQCGYYFGDGISSVSHFGSFPIDMCWPVHVNHPELKVELGR